MEICAGAGIPDAVLDGRYLRSFIVFREDAETRTVLRAAAAPWRKSAGSWTPWPAMSLSRSSG